MTELMEWSFQKGGVFGILCFVLGFIAWRFYQDNQKLLKLNHKLEKDALDQEKKHSEELARVVSEAKKEIITLKDECDKEKQDLHKQILQKVEGLFRDQLSQASANTTQMKELAKSRQMDSSLLRDVAKRMEAIEERKQRDGT